MVDIKRDGTVDDDDDHGVTLVSKDESLESTLVSRLSPALSDFHFVGVF